MFFGQFQQFVGLDHITGSIEQHRTIADAIFRVDAPAARNAMKRHVGRSKSMVSALPNSVFRRN